ncbi:acyl carrier protein [Desulfovibrio sp. Huiquan2017]|uniref:acyl carrier protein n=1 Tax=Desulfovibrio sp. Huiquan2017 TaxID=2816861 RepID=UPI001A914774|nr:acyl carrier protein [Desulfovibrio sp. Huiquan2017]
MTDEEVTARIDELLVEEFELDPAAMSPEAKFKDDLDLDSLDAVDMVVVLEQAFHFKIKKDEAFQSIRTLGDLHAFVLEKKKTLTD